MNLLIGEVVGLLGLSGASHSIEAVFQIIK
ncbi:hypothetical protein JOD14_002658 [Enterococcus lemanii]|nr:hypothetical protein [Enterococcus lemanii]